jgi:hypothetical protein
MSGTLSCDEIKLYAVHARRVQMPPRIRVFVEFIAAALHWVNVVCVVFERQEAPYRQRCSGTGST